MTNLLGDVGDERPARLGDIDGILETAGAHLHWYGKREARPLRKMGHVTVTGRDDEGVAELLDRAVSLREPVTFE
jgi:5-(carboxyamino)imidazole ribonucleotide synthase